MPPLNSRAALSAVSRDDEDILLFAETSSDGYIVSINGDVLSLYLYAPSPLPLRCFVFVLTLPHNCHSCASRLQEGWLHTCCLYVAHDQRGAAEHRPLHRHGDGVSLDPSHAEHHGRLQRIAQRPQLIHCYVAPQHRRVDHRIVQNARERSAGHPCLLCSLSLSLSLFRLPSCCLCC